MADLLTFIFVLGVGAFVLGLVACLVEWAGRLKQPPPLQDGETVWSRIQQLKHEHPPHVVNGKPRW